MPPRLYVKPGADLNGLQPGGCRILAVVTTLPVLLSHDVTITCGREGHPINDRHTTGEALDVRTMDLSPEQILAAYKHLATLLGPQFTVLYEVPLGQRDELDARLTDLVYAPSNPNGAHLHAQVKHGILYAPEAA